MTDESAIWIVLGLFASLCGLGLAFAKVAPNELCSKSHSNPMLAVLRFPVWRYAMAFLLVIGGLVVAMNAADWISI